MQIISTATTVQPEKNISIDANKAPAAEAPRVTKNNEETTTAADQHKSEQKDFSAMINDQAKKQDVVPSKSIKVVAETAIKLLVEDQPALLKEQKLDSKLPLVVKMNAKHSQEFEAAKKKGLVKDADLKADEEDADQLNESFVVKESALDETVIPLLVLNVGDKKEQKKAQNGAEEDSVALKLSELSVQTNNSVDSAPADASAVEVKPAGDHQNVKETSLQMNTTASSEKAEIQNVNLADAQASEPIVLVSDRRPQVDLSEAKPLEPSILIRQALRESGNAEIVQRAQFVLREHGAGEIRLTLKPESLGTVRINLSLDDHQVLGRIVVDSAEVKAAFDDNIADLRERMQRSGFTMGNLDVSVGQRNQDGQSFGQGEQGNQPFFSDRYREGSRAFTQVQEISRADSYRSVLVDMRA